MGKHMREITTLQRTMQWTAGLFALVLTSAAGAQDSLDQGKTPAQLFASDCAICHKSPQGLAKGGGLFGVQSFLRQHYTASKELAAAIASYLEAMDRAAGPAPRGGTPPKRSAKGDGTAKPAAGKKTEPAKLGEEPKASESKPAEPKAAEPKAAEPKPAEAKPAEVKPVEAKPAEKPAEAPKVE